MIYRKEIDGLRAIAVLPVILFHTGYQYIGGGFVGVDVFFVISGYLITSLITEELNKGTFSISNFYERRARRILPALLLILTFSAALAPFVMLPGQTSTFSNSILSVLTFTSNIFFWCDSGYFAGASELKPLLHTWSLSVEEQYYIFFPLIAMFVYARKPRSLPLAVLVLCAISFGISEWGAANKPDAAYFLLPARAWEIFAGALIALYRPEQYLQGKYRLALQEALSLAGLGLIIIAVFTFNSSMTFPGVNALVPVLGTMLLLTCATQETRMGKLLGMRALVWVGLLSYSAYLWHQPIFAFARLEFGEFRRFHYLWLIIITFALAYLTWRFVEAPFRNRQKIAMRSVLVSASATALALCAFCVSVSMTAGFLPFYRSENQKMASLEPLKSGEYVRARFDNRIMQEFEAGTAKKKIMLIGDSYAQDLVNAIYESGADAKYDIVTRFIPAKCGNIFAPREFVYKDMSSPLLRRCNDPKNDIYNDASLRQRMAQSDQIWLASNWKPWQVELLPTGIENINKELGKAPVVFGRKNFGFYTIKQLIGIDGAQRTLFETPVSAEALHVNEEMKKTIKGSHFIDLLDLFCATSLPKCKVFTSQGDLISPDGGHLTPSGARLYGERIRNLSILN